MSIQTVSIPQLDKAGKILVQQLVDKNLVHKECTHLIHCLNSFPQHSSHTVKLMLPLLNVDTSLPHTRNNWLHQTLMNSFQGDKDCKKSSHHFVRNFPRDKECRTLLHSLSNFLVHIWCNLGFLSWVHMSQESKQCK